MLVAHRNGMAVWTNPYVTDGLVAMWDGEWNTGGGVHDATLQDEWTDIVGGMKFSSAVGSCSFSQNRAVLSACVLKGINGNLASVFSSGCFSIQYIIPVCTDQRGYVLWRYPPYTNPMVEIQRNGPYFGFCDKGQGFSGMNNLQLQTLTVDGSDWTVITDTQRAPRTVNYTQQTFTSSAGLALLGSQQGAATYFFTGEVCALRFYDRILTDSEISASYAIDRARFNLT